MNEFLLFWNSLYNKFIQRASLSLLMKEFFVVLSLVKKEFLLFCPFLRRSFCCFVPLWIKSLSRELVGIFSYGGKGNTIMAGKFFKIQSKGMLQTYKSLINNLVHHFEFHHTVQWRKQQLWGL